MGETNKPTSKLTVRYIDIIHEERNKRALVLHAEVTMLHLANNPTVSAHMLRDKQIELNNARRAYEEFLTTPI